MRGKHGAVVGAGSVVTKNVEPYAIVVGNPASVIKYRFTPEIVSGLLEIKWWDWSEEKIKEKEEKRLRYTSQDEVTLLQKLKVAAQTYTIDR